MKRLHLWVVLLRNSYFPYFINSSIDLKKKEGFSAHFMSNMILIYKFYNNIKTENNRPIIHSIAPYVNVPERLGKTHTKVVTVPKANGIGAGNCSLMCKV